MLKLFLVLQLCSFTPCLYLKMKWTQVDDYSRINYCITEIKNSPTGNQVGIFVIRIGLEPVTDWM